MSWPNEPTYDECVTLLRECVAERGEDYIYKNPRNSVEDYTGPACLYKHGNEPGCIIGLMLVKHGMPLERFDDQDTMGSVAAIWKALYGHPLAPGPMKQLLVTVQVEQDSFETWGNALRTGLEVANNESV